MGYNFLLLLRGNRKPLASMGVWEYDNLAEVVLIITWSRVWDLWGSLLWSGSYIAVRGTLPCKAKRQYLLSFQVNRYCLLVFQSSTCPVWWSPPQTHPDNWSHRLQQLLVTSWWTQIAAQHWPILDILGQHIATLPCFNPLTLSARDRLYTSGV